jgi:succinate-acetate transporter protein
MSTTTLDQPRPAVDGSFADAAPSKPPHPSPLSGNPGMVGIPTVIAGAIGLGLVDTGYVPASASAAAIPIIMTATAIGLLIATIWAAALAQNASATLFAVFFGFYGSYAALLLGLNHNWFAIPADQVTKTVELWLICWLGTIVLLTLTTLRLPWSFTLLLGLVDVALALLLVGTARGSDTWTHAGGAVVWGFVAVAVYLYIDIMSKETGGKGLPLGRPLLGG